MTKLRVQIVRYVEAYQPGIVECQFRDADGKVLSIIGKLPCFSDENLWFDSEYPRPGEVDCQVRGSAGLGKIRILLAEETTDERSEVVVLETDLVN